MAAALTQVIQSVMETADWVKCVMAAAILKQQTSSHNWLPCRKSCLQVRTSAALPAEEAAACFTNGI